MRLMGAADKAAPAMIEPAQFGADAGTLSTLQSSPSSGSPPANAACLTEAACSIAGGMRSLYLSGSGGAIGMVGAVGIVSDAGAAAAWPVRIALC